MCRTVSRITAVKHRCAGTTRASPFACCRRLYHRDSHIRTSVDTLARKQTFAKAKLYYRGHLHRKSHQSNFSCEIMLEGHTMAQAGDKVHRFVFSELCSLEARVNRPFKKKIRSSSASHVRVANL